LGGKGQRLGPGPRNCGDTRNERLRAREKAASSIGRRGQSARVAPQPRFALLLVASRSNEASLSQSPEAELTEARSRFEMQPRVSFRGTREEGGIPRACESRCASWLGGFIARPASLFIAVVAAYHSVAETNRITGERS